MEESAHITHDTEHTQGHTQAPGGPNNYESSSSNTRIHEVDDKKHTNNNNNYNGISCPAEVRSPNQGKRKRHHSDHDNHRDSLHVQFNSRSLESCSSSSSSSDDEDSSSAYSAIRAPDGGWGWVVVAASFFVNLIGDGITFSFGIIFVDFLNYFGEGKSRTAWIGGVFMAMPLLSGPVASFLADRYGCRRVAIFGAILASTGFVISAFAESMLVLFLTFGVFAGFGLSLCYVASVVIVAYYFDKLRATATGISVSGSGIGTMIFAPLTRYLLAEYGWRGTILILAGFILNICVCGALMRDLPGQQDRLKAQRLAKRKKRTKSQRTTLSSTDSLAQPSEPEFSAQIDPRISSSLLCIPTFVRSGEKVPPEVMELLSTHRNVYNRLLQNYPNLMSPTRSVTDSDMLGEQAAVMSIKSAPPMTLTPPPIDPLLAKMKANPAPRRLTAYLRDLRVHRHSLTYRGAMLNINRYHLRASSCPDIYRNSMTTIAEDKPECYGALWEFHYLLAEMLDFSYFLDIRFLLFAISNFLLYTWYDVPYVYLYDSAIEMGFSETDSSYLISVIGSLNLVGELVLGWLGDQPGVNPTLVYAACMLFCGAATALLPALAPSYDALLILAGSFGLFIAANYSLTSIILVELISIERFTNGYGLLLLVQGMANLIGPPLAGSIYDLTDSYDLTFYLAGIFIALSGILLLILPSIDGIRNYRKANAKAKHSHQTSLIAAPPTVKCNGAALPWEKTSLSHHV